VVQAAAEVEARTQETTHFLAEPVDLVEVLVATVELEEIAITLIAQETLGHLGQQQIQDLVAVVAVEVAHEFTIQQMTFS